MRGEPATTGALVRTFRQLNHNAVARMHITASQHDAHDPGLTNRMSVGIPPQARGHQARLKLIELVAGVAQPCDLDHRLIADPQPYAGRQSQ